jgi:RNA polymerase sigma-70 factor (ECF subfamily)
VEHKCGFHSIWGQPVDFRDEIHGPLPVSTISPSLLGKVRCHDREGWQRMVQLFGPLVYGWARRAGLQAEDAADVVQEVFHSVAKGLASFRRDEEGDSFRGWLWTIAQNKIRDLSRRRRASCQAEGGSDAQLRLEQLAAPTSGGDSNEGIDGDDGLIARALALVKPEFEPRTWQAFWRTTVDGQTTAEIAEDLGMTKGSVRQAKYRVLLRLRRELEQMPESHVTPPRCSK